MNHDSTYAKLLFSLVAFAVVASLIIGVFVGAYRVMQSPEITSTIAEQESAKADTLKAQARQAQAVADQADIETAARRAALEEIAAGKRWIAVGGGIAFAVAVVGLAIAAVTAATTRARIVFPNDRGQFPMYIEKKFITGQLLIVDTSRMVGPVVVADSAFRKIKMPLASSEAVALQIATQAQAANAMIGIANKNAAEDVVKRVDNASQSLPAPTFAHAAAGGGDMRFVYVKTPNNTKESREMQDIQEFIQVGWGPVGLARSVWMQRRFAGSGNKCTRGYYDTLTDRLSRAGVISKDDGGGAWKAAVALDEALDAFGLSAET